MKKTALTVFISGVFLVSFLAQTGCTKQPTTLAMNQGNPSYIVDTQSPDILVSDYNVVFYNTLESPAAGLEEEQKTIPPAIQYLLFSGRGSIGGFVWDDLNGNGVPDTGEPGLQGVTVFVDIDKNGTYSLWEPSDQTDADGTFDIARLKQGTFNVYNDTLTIPNDYDFTTTHPLLIDLARKQNYNDANFGLQEMSGKIGGKLWNDSNGNGNIDIGENAITGSRIYLDQNGNRIFDFGEPSNMSDSDGLYSISSLARGAYLVTLDGNLLNPSYHSTAGTTLPASVTLATGEVIDNVNFGFMLWTGIITGFLLDADTAEGWAYITVFIDLNGNGVYDEGEPTAITDENGMFTFSGMAPGTYTIMVKLDALPGVYNLPITSITLTLDEGDTAYANFLSVAEPASVESYIWDDINANGRRDTGENGLENVRIFSDTNRNGTLDPAELSTLSGPDGFYSLTGLPAGPQWISVDETTLPGDYLLTTNNIPVYQIIHPGSILTEADFGYQERLAIMHSNDYPTRIALRTGGGLYVSDAEQGSVFIYDSGLNLTGELKSLEKPLGVATDSSDNIYVGSSLSNNVEVYDSTGVLVSTIGDGLLKTPNDLIFDREGKLYVVDSHSAKVWIFNPDGSLSGSIGSLGSGAGQFMFPKAIAITYRTVGTEEVGEIYVGDYARQLVQVFDMLGNYLRSFGGPVQTGMSSIIWQGLFSALQSMDFDQYGRLHTLDSNLDIVQILDPVTGGYIDFYNAHLPENLGKLNLQLDIVIKDNSDVLMSNVATKSIENIYTVPTP